MTRIIICSFFFFVLVMQASLADALSSSETDASKNISQLLQNAQHLVFKNPDSALYLIEQALATKNHLDDDRLQSRAFYLLGNIYLVKARYPEALEYYEKSLSIRQKHGDSAGVSDLYSNIGIAYARMGDQKSYLAYLLKTLVIDRKLKNEHMIAADYNNIGNVYLNTNEPNEALFYYRKALEYSGSLADSSLLYAIYGNIGSVYLLVEKYDSAMFFSQQAIQIARHNRDKNELGTALGNHALLCSKLEQYDSAFHYYDAAIHLLEEIGAKRRYAGVLKDKARLLIRLHDAPHAIELAMQSLSIANGVNDIAVRAEGTEILALGFEMLGDYEKALNYQKSYIVLRDSMNLSGKEADLQKLMRQFEVSEKKREIKQLEMKNKFERSRNQMLIIMILMVVFFLTILFYKNRKLNRSYHMLLEKQKQIVEYKTSLTDTKHRQTEETPEQKELIKKLELLLEQEKVFLDAGISLDAIAETLNTNRNALSALINLHYRKNFNILINDYRIDEVIRLLAENHHNLYTLEAISKQVGFGNRASFNAAFKRVTGVTPTFYIRNL